MRMDASFLWRVFIIGVLSSLFVTDVQAEEENIFFEYENEAVSATFVGVSQFAARGEKPLKNAQQMKGQKLPKLQWRANKAWLFSTGGTINLHQAKKIRPSFGYMAQEPRRLFVKYTRKAVDAISVMDDGQGGFFENGVVGRDFCVNGDVIHEPKRCTDAATKLGMTYSGNVNQANRPKGCMSDPKTNTAWFNMASPGAANLDRAPVCNLRAFDVHVNVGTNWSGTRTKEVDVDLTGGPAWLDCPSEVTQGGYKFNIDAGVKNGKAHIKVKQESAINEKGWGFNLNFVCKRTMDSSPSAWIDRTLNKYVHAMDGFVLCQQGIATIGAIAGKIGLAGATFDEVRRTLLWIFDKMKEVNKMMRKSPVKEAVKAVPYYGKFLNMGSKFMDDILDASKPMRELIFKKWGDFKMVLLQFNTIMAGIDFAGSATAAYVVGSHRALLRAKRCADLQSTAWEVGRPGWELEQEMRDAYPGVSRDMNNINGIGQVCGSVLSLVEELTTSVNKFLEPLANLRTPIRTFVQAVNTLIEWIEDVVDEIMDSDAMQCAAMIGKPVTDALAIASCPGDEAFALGFKIAQDLVIRNLERLVSSAMDSFLETVVEFMIPDDFAINFPAFDEEATLMDPRWLDDRFGSCQLDTFTNVFFPQFGDMVNNIMRSLPLDMDGQRLKRKILDELLSDPGDLDFSLTGWEDYTSACVEAWNDLVTVPDFSACARVAEAIGCETAGATADAYDGILDAAIGSLDVLSDMFDEKKKMLDWAEGHVGTIPGIGGFIRTMRNICNDIARQMEQAAEEVEEHQQEMDDLKAVQEWSCGGQEGPPPEAAFRILGLMPPQTYRQTLPAEVIPDPFVKIGDGYCADWIYPISGTQSGGYDDASSTARGCMDRCSALNPGFSAFYLKGTQCGCSTTTQGACPLTRRAGHTAYVFAPKSFTTIGTGYCADWVYPSTGTQAGGYDDLSFDAQGCMERCLMLNRDYTSFYLKGTQCGCSTTTNGACAVTSNNAFTAYVLNPSLRETNGPKINLHECTGDCNSDSQCASGLKCFQRTGYTRVPGCNGVGIRDVDYCYDPSGSIKLSGTNLASPSNLAACTGECDSDDQCLFGLKCFERHGGETIPGCTGIGEHPNSGSGRDWDYCYDPSWNAGTELARGKPTLQSSTGWGGSSSRSVDGNTSGIWGHRSCSHTYNGENEWWRVDLQHAADISAVQIFNRLDCCGNRVNGATIMVGATDDVDSAIPCANIDSISGNKVFSCVAAGRFVFIHNAPNQYLQLCEVKVFGTVAQHTCQCTTPKQGTAGKNGMTCTTGETRSCAATEECYATGTFEYGNWGDGCRTPPGSSKWDDRVDTNCWPPDHAEDHECCSRTLWSERTFEECKAHCDDTEGCTCVTWKDNKCWLRRNCQLDKCVVQAGVISSQKTEHPGEECWSSHGCTSEGNTPCEWCGGSNWYCCSATKRYGSNDKCGIATKFSSASNHRCAKVDAPITCQCTTPNQGTAGKNGMTCTNGETRSCAATEECYATGTFDYGKWGDGCRTPRDPRPFGR